MDTVHRSAEQAVPDIDSKASQLGAAVAKPKQLTDVVGFGEDILHLRHKLENHLDLQSQLETSKRMEALLLDSENTLKEAVAEGNQDEVQQLQAQIDSLKQLIKDYNELLKSEADRGGTIDEIAAQICPAQEIAKPQTRRPSSILDCFSQLWGSCFTLGS